jgi:vitamin B12 transporter
MTQHQHHAADGGRSVTALRVLAARVASAATMLGFAAAAAAAAPALLFPATAAAQTPIPLDTLRATAGSRAALGAASVTRSVDILDRRAIEALPARSVSEVLGRALGVDLLARSHASADVAIRGSGFEQILVMVDGVPVNDDQTGHFHLDVAVPLAAVERIEVLRGPASALYGSAAVGGVINIVTRRGQPELSARMQTGSFGTLAGAVEAAGQRGGWGARISAEHDRADGHRPGTDHAATLARLAMDAPLAGGALRVDFGYAARDFGANAFYAPFDSYEETRTLTGALSWLGATSRLSVQPRLSVRRHEDDFILRRDDPAFYRNLHTNRQLSGELVVRWRAADRLNVAAGTEATGSRLESTNLGDHDETRFAGFAELAAGDVASFLLTVGVRLDDHSTFGRFLSPSLAAGYRVSPALRLRASAASGYRAPNWTERFYRDPGNIGNPELDAETFRTAELGTELELGRVRLDLAGFVRRSDDMIDWARAGGSPPSAPWQTLNIQRATFRGGEATAATRLARVQLIGRASLIGFSAEAAGGMTSKYALRPLTRALSLEAAAPLTAALTLSGRAADFRRAGTATGAAIAGAARWQLVDARLSWSRGGVRLFADATNIADATFADVSGEPAPGRAFSLGGRLRR